MEETHQAGLVGVHKLVRLSEAPLQKRELLSLQLMTRAQQQQRSDTAGSKWHAALRLQRVIWMVRYDQLGRAGHHCSLVLGEEAVEWAQHHYVGVKHEQLRVAGERPSVQFISCRHALDNWWRRHEAQSWLARERRMLLFGKHYTCAEQHEKVAAALLDTTDRAVQHEHELDRAE